MRGIVVAPSVPTWMLGMCLLLALIGLVPPQALAAEMLDPNYPSRRITLVVPFAAGGTTDLLGRLVAEQIGRQLGVPVTVENRPGAGTAVAAEQVARAVPDGYTLLLGSSSTFVFNPLVTQGLRYDPDRDFTGITLLASAPMVLLVPGTTRASNWVSWLKRGLDRPGQLNFGSPGRGSSLHLAFESLLVATGLRMAHIPYRGSQPALHALAAGEIDAYIDLVPTAKAAVDSGAVRALAALGSQRSPAMPGVPTLREQGGPSMEVAPWFALVGPAGLPPHVVERLNASIHRGLGQDDTRQRMALLSFDLQFSPPKSVMPHFKEDRQRWAELIRQRGIVVEP